MFCGTFYHTLDEKGRVAIPRKFRELLGSQSDAHVFVTPSLGRDPKSLDIYPVTEWEALAARIRAMPQLTESTRRFKRRYLHPAQELVLDSQGRILIPQDLRETIGLVKDAVFTGDLEKFLIWDRHTWQRQKEEDEKVGNDDESYDKLGL